MQKPVKWTIQFTSGKTKVITNEEYDRMLLSNTKQGSHRPKWNADDGAWVFLDHIEHLFPCEFEDVEEEEDCEILEPEEEKDESEPLSDEEKLQRLMEMSSCTHEEESLYWQQTKTGLKFFPVCDKCGRRGRYVAAGKLDSDDKKDAKEWIEKE
jgi:hypothetical protein